MRVRFAAPTFAGLLSLALDLRFLDEGFGSCSDSSSLESAWAWPLRGILAMAVVNKSGRVGARQHASVVTPRDVQAIPGRAVQSSAFPERRRQISKFFLTVLVSSAHLAPQTPPLEDQTHRTPHRPHFARAE